MENGNKFNFIEPIEHKKDFIEIRFQSDYHLPFGKVLNIPVMVVTVSVFQEVNEYYQTFFCMNVCINL